MRDKSHDTQAGDLLWRTYSWLKRDGGERRQRGNRRTETEGSRSLVYPKSMQHSLCTVTLHSSKIDAFSHTGSPTTHVTSHGLWFYTCKRQTTMHTAGYTCHSTAAGHLIWAYCSRLLSPLLYHAQSSVLAYKECKQEASEEAVAITTCTSHRAVLAG